ncbi:MAG: ATP synthase F1 subunit delta [Candidatus Eisenbacteria bacterium]|nr:ATP synthase F1 subunit delta [Candidatus Eisenbacteria bacterium]
MMQDTTIASRYARALFLVTEKRGETPPALADLKGMLEVLGPDSRVGRFLGTPGIRLADKREGLKRSLASRVLPIVVVFLDLLLRKKRLAEFTRVVSEFEALVEKQQGIRRAEVVSAEPLGDKEKRRLHAALERWTKAKIRLAASVDSSLMGGALVKIGNRVIDRSVRTLLSRIGERLMETSV